ncbi:PREDICTED: acyl-CoA-binding domain-containing protein 1-like [Amphimedon queenslandica]|uniref:Acyl-CoA-binding domain-containing protein 6 n=1 Tax=Amphimedon queenslandica TaxID=400682 RepID=A0A1X7V1U3_AMPQE|nr:PREDICTED: acyl-CoA-binding domain-containing protein 1-like [Amphimedon queenslandica]|eukprot:XP_003385934.1 PREDICTED: acyl-CoA-binding domain-containing protein 1-like [Amphimedon queenslandica]
MVEQIDVEDVDCLFQRAAERMRSNTNLQLSDEQRLELYGYYKQATEGPCTSRKPGFFDFTGKAKWEAWNKLGTLSSSKAKEQYVRLVDGIDPRWRDSDKDEEKSHSSGNRSNLAGPVVSRMAVKEGEEDKLTELQKKIIDWSTEGNVERVKECIANGESTETKDENGMTPLHWACDRGYIDIVECLIQNGADVQAKDNDEQTPLHYATSCGHRDVALFLIKSGANVTAIDNTGQSPVDVCEQNIKDIFN